MLATVDLALNGRLIIGPRFSRPIHANLRYLSDDPFAVHLTFPAAISLEGADVEWVFSRELLAGGMREPAGDGDVHLWPCGPDRVMVEFESPHGTAMVEFGSADLRSFLRWSYRSVPLGREADCLDLDTELSTLLDAGP
ncbi:MAG: SsgA family sporulation/cell division regulator [Actinocrinis sp.]